MPTCPNPKCQVEVNDGVNFCTTCGYNLSADTPSPAESQGDSEIFARRVSANEIEESAFSSSLVIRPGSFGVEIRDSMVTGVLSMGRQTVDGIMDRLRGLFSSDPKKEVVIIDERPVILALNTNIPNQTLRIFLNAETDKDALSMLVERVVGNKKRVSARDLQTQIKKFLNEKFSVDAIGGGDDVEIQQNMHDALINQFGLDAAFEVDRGLPRHHFDLTVGVSEIDEMVCWNCNENILPNVKFCTQCGKEQDPAGTSAGLVSKDLTSLVADNMTRTRHQSNRELIGQGIGNSVAGLFGAIPGAGATMRTVVNIRSGGQTKISGMIHALILFAVVLVLAPYAANIPHAVLAGILIKVGYDIIDFAYLKRAHKGPRWDLILMVLVLGLTVFVDLITAVMAGVVLAALAFVRSRILGRVDLYSGLPFPSSIALKLQGNTMHSNAMMGTGRRVVRTDKLLILIPSRISLPFSILKLRTKPLALEEYASVVLEPKFITGRFKVFLEVLLY